MPVHQGDGEGAQGVVITGGGADGVDGVAWRVQRRRVGVRYLMEALLHPINGFGEAWGLGRLDRRDAGDEVWRKVAEVARGENGLDDAGVGRGRRRGRSGLPRS